MSSELEDALLEAFEVLEEKGQAVAIVKGPLDSTCISTPFIRTVAMKEAGLWEGIESTIEIPRSEFVRLSISDRCQVKIGGTALIVHDIEDDPKDPFVRFKTGKR